MSVIAVHAFLFFFNIYFLFMNAMFGDVLRSAVCDTGAMHHLLSDKLFI